ncbi:MAG: hypothetical protein ABI166_07865, partial [Mucilaginibacter sp.]
MKKIAKIALVITAVLFAAPKIMYAQVSAGVRISARIAPPALLVYTQPACPVDGYLWQPGYWAYDADASDYYWVPGVWVAPPSYGLLWTPAYWAYDGGVYAFHGGYWGPHIGFYGGINYGGGFFGVGFAGGSWQGNHFRYNTAVVNVNRTIVRNTYIDRTVILNHTVVNNHTSFNGRGGVTVRPRLEEQQAMREHHMQPTNSQIAHQQKASKNQSQFATVNHGRPSTPAMSKARAHRSNTMGNTTDAHSTSNIARPQANNHNNGTQRQQMVQAQRAQQHIRQQKMQVQYAQQEQQQRRADLHT